MKAQSNNMNSQQFIFNLANEKFEHEDEITCGNKKGCKGESLEKVKRLDQKIIYCCEECMEEKKLEYCLKENIWIEKKETEKIKKLYIL